MLEQIGAFDLTRDLHVITVGDDGTRALAQLLSATSATVLQLDSSMELADLNVWLSDQNNSHRFDRLHLYSHGQSGRFMVGGQTIDGDSLTGLSDALQTLGGHLGNDADLLIYGCFVGEGDAGQRLVSDLAAITGADVAASNDSSGGMPGANWVLEVRSSDAMDFSQDIHLNLNWQGTLALPAIAAVLGEAVVGAFAGWAVEQIMPGSSTDPASYTNNTTINLVFRGDGSPSSEDPKPAPIPTGIQPDQDVTSAIYLDSSGDLVDIRLSGPGSFRLKLFGDLTNNADALELVLKDIDASTGLSVSVSPLEQSINGGAAASGVNGQYTRMFSPGYTTLNRLTSIGGTSIGDIELTAAIVNTIDLEDLAIGSIELDSGFTTLVDRVNTNTLGGSVNVSSPTITIGAVNAAAELEVFDESPTGPTNSTYHPVTGLIDLGDINARSIGLLTINGSISAATVDPNDDEPLTNDLRGTITVRERIGAIQAQRSALTGAIRAGSLGTVNLGRIRGEITTTDPKERLNLNLTSDFRGFINAAGHLDLGFSFTFQDPGNSVPPPERIYGEIQAGGGISGSELALNDSILLPHNIFNVFRHTGTGIQEGGNATTNTIADLRINGLGTSRWISAGDIGNISANSFSEAMLVEAGGNIGNIEAYLFNEIANPTPAFPPEPAIPTQLNGLFHAGGNIGTVRSATSVAADLRAGGNIGAITAVSGGIESQLIEAEGNIGDLWSHRQSGGATKIASNKGSIGNLRVDIGDWSSSLSAATDIGNITLAKGSLNQVKIAAGGSIGNIKVSGSQGGIIGSSIVAADDIGTIEVSAKQGIALQGVLIQAGSDAGDRLDGIVAESYGTVVREVITPGLGTGPATVSDQAAIQASRILAAEIGMIQARSREGAGMVDTVVHAQRSNLDGIVAQGNIGGMLRATVVAEQDIGPVHGIAEVQGSGIEDSRINANTGSIGSVSGRGGVAGGHGLVNSYLQASTRISGIQGESNANQGDAIRQLTAYAGSFGTIKATVRGGEGTTPTPPPPPFPARVPTGSGIVESLFKGFENQPSSPTPGIEAILVEVGSIEGNGIFNSTFSVKDSISGISVKAFNNSAILNSNFNTSSGVIGSIDAEATHRGSAILGSRFTANNGDIGRLGGITASANGTAFTDNGIETSHFAANNGIGVITAFSKGGSSILGSTFMADTDLSGAGSIAAIKVDNEGQNEAASMGISGSIFEAADIDSITVNMNDFEGGTAINGSSFIARTATYDGNGNFDNKGRIGDITIDSLSRIGHGIDGSSFVAGAAGSIGNINVDLITRKLAGDVDGAANGSSGKGIVLSRFQASNFDWDQNIWNGRIGNISVKAGRVIPALLSVGAPPNDQLTFEAAGIDRSYFAALGGIGDINIETIGTAVFASAFLADFDVAGLNNALAGSVLSGLAANVSGNIGNITIRTNGRFAVGSAASIFTGAGIGHINIEANALNISTSPIPTIPQSTGNPVTDLVAKALEALSARFNLAKIFSDVFNSNQRFGLAAVVGSAFAALESDIGSIRLVNTGATGQTALASVFLAANSYGPVSSNPPLRQDWLDKVLSVAAQDLLKIFTNIKGVSVYRDIFVLFVGQLRPGTVVDPDQIDPSALPVATVAVPGVSAQTAFKEGDILNFSINFYSPVLVEGKPTLGLTIGGNKKQASYSSGSGSANLIFSYKIEPGDLAMPSAEGNGQDSPVSLDTQLTTSDGNTNNNGNIFYRGSNIPIGTITLQAIGNPRTLPIDAVKPNVLSANNNIPLLGDTRPAGSILVQNIIFDEVVNVKGTPIIEAKIGSRIRKLQYVGGAGTNTLQFSYVLTSQDRTGSISITPTIKVDTKSSITDLAGNNASLAIPITPTPSPLTSRQSLTRINSTAPQPTTISSTNDDSFTAKSNDQAVLVNPGPQNLTPGGYINSDANVERSDSKGSISRGGLQTFDGPNALPIEVVRPSVISATNNITLLGNIRQAGSVLEQSVTFDEIVNVKEVPTVEAKIGKRIRKLTYVSGAGTDTLLFRYILTRQDSRGAISLTQRITIDTQAAITDLAGNTAALTIPAAPTTAELLSPQLQSQEDTTAPMVVSVNGATNDTNTINLPLLAGTPLEVTLKFSEPVLVNGKPYLQALIGKRKVRLTYSHGSASNELTFRLIVRQADLRAGSALVLDPTFQLANRKTWVRDHAGNNAALTLFSRP